MTLANYLARRLTHLTFGFMPLLARRALQLRPVLLSRPSQGAVHAAAVLTLADCAHPRQARLGLPTIGLAPVEQWAPVSVRQPANVLSVVTVPG